MPKMTDDEFLEKETTQRILNLLETKPMQTKELIDDHHLPYTTTHSALKRLLGLKLVRKLEETYPHVYTKVMIVSKNNDNNTKRTPKGPSDFESFIKQDHIKKVLDAIEEKPRRLPELQDIAGRSKTNTNDIMIKLVEHGYAEKETFGNYNIYKASEMNKELGKLKAGVQAFRQETELVPTLVNQQFDRMHKRQIEYIRGLVSMDLEWLTKDIGKADLSEDERDDMWNKRKMALSVFQILGGELK